ncbi:hypothetical protein SESBI_29660 [Sesbania bispinosa]|nr:hypothetical protein SESBI_29660 [Sesbania bispinosa]
MINQVSSIGVQGQNNAAVDVSVVNVEGERQEGDGIIGNVSAGDEDGYDSSDESLHNVHFNDSEEERDLGSDDGFNLPEHKRKKRRKQPIFDESGISQNVDESGPTQNVDEEGARATNAVVNDVPATTEVPHAIEAEFVPENISNMHQMDDDYSTEELESDCYDSALEDNDRPHYPKYKQEDMSRWGGSSTFRVKTLVGRHNCGRWFANKNASTKWVARVVVDKFREASI